MGVCARVPYGPLPVEMVTVCDVTMLPVPLHVALEAVGVRSITPAQRQRGMAWHGSGCSFDYVAWHEPTV